MLSLLAFAAVANAAFTHDNNTVSGPNTAASQVVPFTYDFVDCVNGPLSNNSICDPNKDPVTRAQALVSLFTTTELIENSVHEADGVPRLGLPAYNWWSEALHGVAWTGPGVSFAASGPFSYATSFPQIIGLGATFDDELAMAVATVISTEARAFSNAQRAGLDYFTPNINPWRDPRWGRGQETPGEDSFHTAQYVYNLIQGLQGGIDPEPYIKIIAVCKHYAAYDMDDWGGIIQRQFNAIVTTQELSEYYLQPFQSCVRDAKVNGVMCSYNSVNGVPACADSYILQTILRDYWKYDDERWVVSDCDAVQSIADEHNYTATYQAAAAAALKAGTDLNCGSTYFSYLQDAIDEGLIVREDIEKALVRAYASLARLGYFDSADKQPYRQLNWNDVSTPSSEKLAYTVAANGFVLLKNDGTLPLKKTLKKMALIGPWANATDGMQGNYFGTPPFLISPLMGAMAAGFDVTYVPGTSSVLDDSTDGFADAVAAAQAADVVVFAGGIDESVEAEGLDRTTIVWPGSQLPLIQALAGVGKPFIVLQFGAGQVDDSWLLSSKAVHILRSLLLSHFSRCFIRSMGSFGRVILDRAAEPQYSMFSWALLPPAGRLPLMQYPADYVNQVPMTDMNLRPNKTSGNPGRTYKWYTGTPVIDYGFGLHYTTFALQWHAQPAAIYDIQTLVAKAKSAAHLDIGAFDTFSVTVRNTGHTTSDFVSLMFVKTTAGPAPFPNKALIGYTRVHGVGAGSSATATIKVALNQIARTDSTGSAWLYPGAYTLSVDVPEQLTHSFVLIGTPAQLTDFPAAGPVIPPPQSSVQSDDAEHELLAVPEHKMVLEDTRPAQKVLDQGDTPWPTGA
ncbi:Glycoside hydrolase family 3 protein [Mycena sanguinolenta]|uniref:xylan 1,4-beta-xylosidase n=1 Tax=Mycena sanguinolenta TaxID=230812 RepID=A0A8H6ZC46_9AGAR|nr:Glycoside hydrolase family 3 protein [Mycena sanguinolenta]